MTKTRILFLSDAPLEKPGGAQISMKILIEGLRDEFDFHMISPGETKYFENHHLMTGITTMVLSKNGLIKSLAVMNRLRKIINDIKPDIIHVQTSSSVILLNALLGTGMLRKGFSVVYTDREVYTKYGKLTRKSIDSFIKRAEKVVTTTRVNEENYSKHCPVYQECFDRFIVIPNTAGPVFEDGTIDSMKGNSDHGKSLTVGFCSRFIPNKNWHLAKEIMSRLNNEMENIKFVVVMGSDPGRIEEMRTFCDELRGMLGDRIRIHVDVDLGRMPGIYDGMDVLVMTSKVESFGRTAVEAMARRTVVLGPPNDGIPEVIGDERYIYRDSEDGAEKVKELLESPEKTLEAKEYFYNRYWNRFAVKGNVESHRQIYLTVMKRKERQKLLFMGPLPPPIGGDTVSFSRIIKSRGFENYSRNIIDTSRKGGIRITGRRIDLSDITNGLKILFKVLINAAGHDTLVFYSNRRFLYTVGLGVIFIEKMFKKRIIIRVFGGSFHKEMDRLPGPYRKFALAGLRKMDHFLVQTKELQQYILDNYGFKDSQVVHYPNFVPDSIKVGRKPERSNDGCLRCIYIGQIKEEKGVFDIMDARGLFEGFTCNFYGPVYDRDRKRFEDEISDADGMEYKGSVDSDNVCRIMSGYDLLILPSYHDGEGYAAVVFEAFAVGLPVIVTNWNAFPEFVANGENGFLVPVKDPEAIADKIRILVESSETYNKLCDGAEATSDMFSEEKIVRGRLIPLIEKER